MKIMIKKVLTKPVNGVIMQLTEIVNRMAELVKLLNYNNK